MNNAAVSVCVPSYNHSRYISDNLHAIFNQTHQPLELIVIDDGSTDNSPEIIEKILADCPFDSKLIVRPNKGLPATINEGLDLSRGEFFAIIASDDIWLPDFLKHRVTQLQNHPDAVLAYGNCYAIDENNQIFGSSIDWNGYGEEFARNKLTDGFCPAAPTVLFRKSALNIQKWNPDAMVEDYELCLRLCLLGKFAFDPEILSGYRVHQSNMSKNTKLLLEGKIQAFELNAKAIGLTSQELSEIKTKMEWEFIDRYIHSGQRLKAIKTAVQCSGVKVSGAMKVRQFLKLMLPYSFVEAGRKLIKRKSDKWHGINIKDLMVEK